MAQAELGLLLSQPELSGESQAEGAKFLQQAAEKGLATAQAALAERLELGDGVVADVTAAERWYRAAAEQGFAAAQNGLGMLYARGLVTDPELARRVEFVRTSTIDAGSAKESQETLAKLFQEQREKNEKEAINWVRKAAEQKYPAALFNLASLLEAGRGVPADQKEALRLYRESAEANYFPAQRELASRYSEGKGGLTRNDAEAIRWLMAAAEGGDPVAQTDLASRYAEGSGVEKDGRRAIFWYSKAAAQEFAPAQHVLGNMHLKGLGMAQNDEVAVRWFRKAADQGYVPAQLTLGALCAEGRGVAKDVNEATRWFKLAAEQGSPLGQARYGIALARGEGVLRNIVEAWAWLKLSDEERAKEWLDAVSGKMTEKQHARAETRLEELRKQYPKSERPTRCSASARRAPCVGLVYQVALSRAAEGAR